MLSKLRNVIVEHGDELRVLGEPHGRAHSHEHHGELLDLAAVALQGVTQKAVNAQAWAAEENLTKENRIKLRKIIRDLIIKL